MAAGAAGTSNVAIAEGRGGRITWHVPALALVAFVTLFSRFLRVYFYGLFEDDFYYYALVAKHIVLTHRSTFDGTHLTNGYHPLWMVVVTACYGAFTGIGFFLAVQGVALCGIVVFYFGVLRCVRALGVQAGLERLLALVLSLHALLLFRYGMEVTLALPFGVWTVAYVLAPGFRWTGRQTFTYGVLASLTVLSRLDSILLMALLMGAQTWRAGVPWSERLRRIGIYCAGWFPFVLYLGLNVHMFHALLPVSGSAKQLKPFWPPSARPLLGLFLPLDRNKAAFVYPAVAVIVAGAVVLLRRSLQRMGDEQRAVVSGLLLFPLVHYTVLCALSDWTVWPWYYYSLCFALLGATALLLREVPEKTIRRTKFALPTAATALGIYLITYAAFKQPRTILRFVAEYARQHPGTYAMGDGAGAPAYLGDRPFVQLEGLTMDAEYLRLLRARTPLPDVLRRYGADYYVSFRGLVEGRCLLLNEPQQGGPSSPKAQGKVCTAPLAEMTEEGLEVDIYRAADVLAR